MGKHIKRRKRGWYFQLDIPTHLRHHFGGKARIEATLGTRDETLAEAKAKAMAGKYKLQFLALEGSPDAERELERANYQQGLTLVREGEVAAFDSAGSDPVELGVELAIDRIIDKPGRKHDDEGPILTPTEEATVSGLMDALRQKKGDGPLHRDKYEPTFAAVAAEWLKAWKASPDRRPSNTGSQYGSAIRLFGDYWRNKTTREITEADTARFVELLRKLPPNHGRGKLANIPLQELVKLDLEGQKGLSPTSIKRHMVVLSQVWNWAKPLGYCAGDNPFKIKLPTVRKKPYLAWEKQELETLYSKRPKRDDVVEVFTVALHSGLRLHEIADMTWGKVREEDGIPFFLVDDPKTEAGYRKVPIHSKLAWLNDKDRKKDSDPVWPSFTPEGPRKSRSGDASKLFGAWKRATGFTNRRYCFHSARKNFVTQLEESGARESDVARLVGHELGLTYGTYSPKGLGLAALSELVELVSYPEAVALPLPLEEAA